MLNRLRMGRGAALVALLAAASFQATAAQVVFDNLIALPDFPSPASSAGPSFGSIAQRFTVTDSFSSLLLRLTLQVFTSSESGGFDAIVTLAADDIGWSAPGATLATFNPDDTNLDPLTPRALGFTTTDGFDLTADSSYWVVMSGDSTQVEWLLGSDTLEPSALNVPELGWMQTSGSYAMRVEQTPEPAGWALLAAGLGLVALRQRRRRSARA